MNNILPRVPLRKKIRPGYYECPNCGAILSESRTNRHRRVDQAGYPDWCD